MKTKKTTTKHEIWKFKNAPFTKPKDGQRVRCTAAFIDEYNFPTKGKKHVHAKRGDLGTIIGVDNMPLNVKGKPTGQLLVSTPTVRFDGTGTATCVWPEDVELALDTGDPKRPKRPKKAVKKPAKVSAKVQTILPPRAKHLVGYLTSRRPVLPRTLSSVDVQYVAPGEESPVGPGAEVVLRFQGRGNLAVEVWMPKGIAKLAGAALLAYGEGRDGEEDVEDTQTFILPTKGKSRRRA